MGRPVYISSDFHFGDRVVYGHRERYFNGIKEMNDVLKRQWDEASDEGRHVFVGDLGRKRPPISVIKEYKLKPLHIFVKGNHDQVHSRRRSYLPYLDLHIKDGGQYYHLIFIHNPRHISKRNGEWVVHGHIHSHPNYPFFDPKNKRINVAWDRTGAPIPLTLILTLIKKKYPRVNHLKDLPYGLLEAHYNGFFYVAQSGIERFK